MAGNTCDSNSITMPSDEHKARWAKSHTPSIFTAIAAQEWCLVPMVSGGIGRLTITSKRELEILCGMFLSLSMRVIVKQSLLGYDSFPLTLIN
jgi:hypothetical protein